MRTMFDSIDPARIPAASTLILGYVDGRWQTVAPERARFPAARVVTCTVFGAAGANVADCEYGDLSPAQAAAWAKAEVVAGRHPTIYCNASTRAQVDQAAAAVGLRPDQWEHLIAQYDGIAQIPPGCIGKQYRSDTNTNLDTSVVADFWPGVDPSPAPAPAPTIGAQRGDLVMLTHADAKLAIAVLDRPAGGKWIVYQDGGVANIEGAPFFGSYALLCQKFPQQGAPVFTDATVRCGIDGFTLLRQDGGTYDFGADLFPALQAAPAAAK